MPPLLSLSPLTRAGLYALFLAVLFCTGYWYGMNHIQKQWDMADIQKKAETEKLRADASEKARQDEANSVLLVAEIDRKQEDLNHAKAENDDLRRRIAAGVVRVRVPIRMPATCPVSEGVASASLDDGTTTAELDAETAQRMVGITDDGDRAIRKLTALQQYVNQVVTPVCGVKAE